MKLTYTNNELIRSLSTRAPNAKWTDWDEVSIVFSRRTELFTVKRVSNGLNALTRSYRFPKRAMEQFRLQVGHYRKEQNR